MEYIEAIKRVIDTENIDLVKKIFPNHAGYSTLLGYDTQMYDLTICDNILVKYCAEKGYVSILNHFFFKQKKFPSGHQYNANADDDYAIRKAAKNGHTEMVKFLLTDPKVNPSARSNSAIRNAALNGHLDIVKLLCADPRVDVACESNTPFINAARMGHIDIVDFLLSDPRVDPGAQSNAAIRFACLSNAADKLKVIDRLLMDPQVNPSDNNDSAIIWAGYYGHNIVVDMLAHHGVDPATRDNQLLATAAEQGNDALVSILLGFPTVNPSARDNCAIHWAAPNSHEQIVCMLLDHPWFRITEADYDILIQNSAHDLSMVKLLKKYKLNLDFAEENDAESDPTSFQPINPELTFVSELLNVLDQNKVKATFMSIGRTDKENTLTIRYA